jgi:undecaprenyl-diphosphatase
VNPLEAIVLGIVQGLTEFLPVSSSGHLLVVERLFGQFREDLVFEVAVHLASAVAAFIFFFNKIISLFRSGNRKILVLILVASIPAGAAGLVFKKLEIIEGIREQALWIVAVCFFVTAAVLKLSDLGKEKGFEMRGTGWRRSLLVGLGQAAGLMPGISRSGATISAGLLAGMKRQDAVEFSFFLAIPAIVGANILEVALKLLKPGGTVAAGVGLGPLLAGFAASFVVSIICIKILVVLVRRKLFSAFAWYCIVAGIATIVIVLV